MITTREREECDSVTDLYVLEMDLSILTEVDNRTKEVEET